MPTLGVWWPTFPLSVSPTAITVRIDDLTRVAQGQEDWVEQVLLRWQDQILGPGRIGSFQNASFGRGGRECLTP